MSHKSPVESTAKIMKDPIPYRALIKLWTDRNELFNKESEQIKAEGLVAKSHPQQESECRIRSMTDRNGGKSKRLGQEFYSSPSNRTGKSKYLANIVSGSHDEPINPGELRSSEYLDEIVKSQRYEHYKQNGSDEDRKNSHESADNKDLIQERDLEDAGYKNLPVSKKLNHPGNAGEIIKNKKSDVAKISNEHNINKTTEDRFYNVKGSEDIEVQKDSQNLKSRNSDKYFRSLEHDGEYLDRGLRPGEYGIQKYGAEQDAAIYKDIHGENLVFHTDDPVHNQ
jgi:hypothetical protein